MFGLIDLVVRAERDLRDKPMCASSEPRFELLAGLWHHKMLLLTAASVLALLIIGGSGI